MRSISSITKKVLVVLVIVFCVLFLVLWNTGLYTRKTGDRVGNRHFMSGSLDLFPKSPNTTLTKTVGTFVLSAQAVANQITGEQTNLEDKTKTEDKQNLIPSVEQTVDLQPLDDFLKYPCVTGLPPFPESKWPEAGRCVRTFNDSKKANELKSKCVPLKTKHGTTPICTYDAVKDHFISKSLQTRGEWEWNEVSRILEFLESDSNLEFLDLGCNIGTYTLAVAHHGRKVVAVDALIDNLELIHKSLTLGKLHGKVTLIWNAIADGYSKVGFTKYEGNVGGTAIRNVTQDDIRNKGFIAQTIKLDDLVPLFKGKRIVIKMDIETKEYSALTGGKNFFDQVDIPMIQMEINWHRTRESGPKIVNYLAARNFKPYSNTNSNTPLNLSDIAKWPGDVYFIKDRILS